ncbi:MAG: MMPL family transporter [Pseudomonadota bacterium]
MPSWFNSRKLAQSFHRRPFLWLAGILVSLLPSAYLASKLSIRSDFKELLPQDRPSVVAMDHLVQRVGGISSLIVAIQCEDFRATERFISDLVPRLKRLPPQYVRYVESNISDLRDFFTKNKYLYVDLEDLVTIHDRLARKIRYEKLRRNPFFIALEEDKVEFDVGDIENKYESKTKKYDEYLDGYFFGESGRLAAVVIRPYGSSTGTGFAKDLMGKVQTIIDEMNPSSYHPSMRVDFTGKFRDTVNEYGQLIRDVLSTLALCLILVAGSLYLYFLRFRAIWILTCVVGIGALWTFALTRLAIGYLNSQTAFLGSIIVGNGVNYGIILLARYMEERRNQAGVEDSLAKAIETTWAGTLTAAVTTSVAFAALGVSDIKGFTQFGFIGGVGMTLCWIGTYLALPPLMVVTEKVLPIVRGGRFVSKQWEFLLYPVGILVSHGPKIIAGFGIILAVSAVALAVRFLPNSLEYDFSKLRTRPHINPAVQSLKGRVQDIFGLSLSPVVVLLNDPSEAKYVCDAVMKREAGVPDADKTIDTCKTLQSYLPTEQNVKLKELAKIRKLLQDHSLNFVSPKYRKEIDDFRKAVDLEALSMEDLPDSIKRNFQEMDGTLGRFAFVYSKPEANLNNGRTLIRFADTLTSIRLPNGSVVRMSGEAAIFADILKAVRHDGPIATILAFILVALAVVVNFRKARTSIYVVSGLVLGVIFMMGIQSALGIKLNFFNFIAFPVTFGIGVDYGVNLFQRYRFEGAGSVRRVLGTVGGAIVLCSITTIIGYATLLWAQSQALASFGWLGLIGELGCIFASIVIMPAFIQIADRRREKIKRMQMNDENTGVA